MGIKKDEGMMAAVECKIKAAVGRKENENENENEKPGEKMRIMI